MTKRLKKINKKKFKNKKFEVCIKSKFKKGKMNFGELLISGKLKKKKSNSLISVIHPYKDNLSGVILTTLLARFIQSIPNLKWPYG